MSRRRMTTPAPAEAETETPTEAEAEVETIGGPSTALSAWSASGGALAVSDEDAIAALAGSSQSHSTGGTEFVSFSGKRGTWELGRERQDDYSDWLAILDYRTIVEGWTCWKGGSPVGKVSWSVYNRAAEGVGFGALQDHGPYAEGDGWSPLLGGKFLLFFAGDEVRHATFETNSKSGRNAFGDLQRDVLKQIATPATSKARFPVMEFGRDTFVAQGKTNYLPVFKVLGWATEDEVTSFMEDPGSLETFVEVKQAPPPPSGRRRSA